MTNKEIARRAKGRVRRARQQQQRSRTVGFSIIALLAMMVFASTAFDFVQRDQIRVLSGKRSYFYQFPEIQLVIAQAKRGLKSGLPSLLNLDDLFPKLRKREIVAQEDASEGKDDGELVDVKPLDDLRAAPPKSLFLDAIFESGGLETSDDYPPIQLSQDFTGRDYRHIGGDPEDRGNAPPIPEPSTGVLMSLGLGILAAISRRRKYQQTTR